MSTAIELLEQLDNIGVAVKVEAGELLMKGPTKDIPKDLWQRLHKHKLDVIQQVVIREVAQHGKNMTRYVTDQEFTDRILILNRACQDGAIDKTIRDQGLEFLLQHWRPMGQKGRVKQ
jgi:hypothetical protein